MGKLSFIKLDIEIMNDSKIKIMRKMPGGAGYFELWIGLLCLAMKSGRPGCIEVGDGIPFTPEMLSAEFDIDQNTVKMGLELFQKLKMIEFFEDETIFLTNFEKHQELTRIEEKKIKERERKKIYRAKVKELSRVCPVGQDADGTFCPTTDIDRDKDKEIEEEFERWWFVYPKKKDKKNAKKKYIVFKKSGAMPELEEHISIIKRWAETDEWKKEGGQFVPNGSTWINGERWNDELPKKSGSHTFNPQVLNGKVEYL